MTDIPSPAARSGLLRVVGFALVLSLSLACGGGAAGGQPAGSTKVTLTEYHFDPSSIDVKSGKVTFFLVNTGALQHDMTITDKSGAVVAKSEQVSAGDTGVFVVDNLRAGAYVFVCDLPGHEQSGMKGTLTAR